MEIKLLKKGIRIDGKYYPVWYSGSSGNIKGNCTIYFKDYSDLGRGFQNEVGEFVDDTDCQTDYFEKPRIRVRPGSKYFEAVQRLAGQWA